MYINNLDYEKARGNHMVTTCRSGSRTAATSKMELFVIIINGFQPLTIITKRSILDVAAVLDPPLTYILRFCVKYVVDSLIA